MPFKDKRDQKESDRLRARRNKEYVRLYKETHACLICSESRTVCLDFHHTNPDTRMFALSDAEKHSIESIEAEMGKCVLVCANCHRVLHTENIRAGLARAADEEILPLFDRI